MFETAKIVNFTAAEQVSYVKDQQMKYDYENVMEYAKEQAHDSGFSEGEARKGLEIARNLLAMGLPADQIVRATGLSSAEVSALR